MAGSPYMLDNEVFTSFIYYATLLLVKTMIMTPLTSWFRITKGSFCSIEDALVAAPNDAEKQKRLLLPDEDVERVRKAHLNDLENILPFVLLAFLYVGTDPNPYVALLHFKVFFFCRVGHSIVYVCGIRQPFRFLCYTVGYLTSFSMAARILGWL